VWNVLLLPFISPKSTEKFRECADSASVNDLEVLRSTLALRFLFLRGAAFYFWKPKGALSLEPPPLVDILTGILGGLLKAD